MNEATLFRWIFRRRWLLAILVLSALAAFARAMPAVEDAPPTVQLTIDYGDGSQRVFTKLAWKEGMTVLELLQAAAKHPRGIKVTHQGKGATALVTALDDVKNQGQGRNWMFEVNDKLADRGCGVWELKGGDAVLWRFDTYR